MRWTKKEKVKKVKKIKPKPKQPEIGDLKEEIKFAFFPAELTDGIIVWLENYKIIYEFKEVKYRIPISLSDVCYEDGSPIYDRLGFTEYETRTKREWILKEKI